MSILDKFKPGNVKKNSTLNFYFGHTEAEGENKVGSQNHENFFDDYLEVLEQLKDEKFIFVGRKGSGKSAIAKFINDTSDKPSDSFAQIIRMDDFQLEKLIQAIPKEEVPDFESTLFEWAILVRLIRLLVKNKEATYSKQYSKLKAFVERNSGLVDIDRFQINEIVKSKNIEVRIEVLKQAFPSWSKYFTTKETKAPFYKLIPLLREVVQEVLDYEVYSGKEYWILFDDLDINFKSDDADSCNNLIKLLRIAKLFNTSILVKNKVRVLIFLRDDAKRIVETFQADTAKMFSSYAITLNWYDHGMFKFDENKTGLKRFINKRIALCFDANKIQYNEDDPWESLFENHATAFNGKSSFKYVLDFSFYRPRDLILFLNPVGAHDYKYPMQPDVLKLLVRKFVAENIRELKSELTVYFSNREIDELFKKLEVIARKPTHKDEAIKIFTGVSEKLDSFQIIKILLNYSVLVLVDAQGKIHIDYREGDQSINLETMKINCHKCLYTFFFPETI
jgi:hypothetical protein